MTGTVAVLVGMSGQRIVASSNYFVNASTIGGASSAEFTLAADGKVYSSLNGDPDVDGGAWVAPPVAAFSALYECRATLVSGSLSSGTTGAWLALTADKSWSVSASGGGPNLVFATFTLEIRLASTGVVMATATVELDAEHV